jgi:hypothetical protein
MVMRWGPDLVKGADGRYHNPELGTVHVRRKAASRSDRYKVVVDGKTVERVGDGSSVAFKVNPGHHGMRIRVTWTGSPVVHFDIGPGETKWFLCEPSSQPGLRRHGVELRQVTGDGADR